MSTDTKLTDLVVNTLTRKQYHEADLTGHDDELFVQSDHAGVFVGANGVDAIDTTNVSNCITEIPQDIKLELNAGTLTLKAGSKVYVPNGSGVFDALTTTADRSTTITAGADQYLITIKSDGSQLRYNHLTTGSGSGTTTPTTGYWIYYNTTDNKVYGINNGTNIGTFSLPVAIVTTDGSQITSIDQVFNGFGYIGSTLFVLPGVKILAANGRNADGILKNSPYTYTTVRTGSRNLNASNVPFWLRDNGNIDFSTGISYDPVTNTILNTTAVYAQGGTVDMTSGVISNFRPKTAFHAVDYNDGDYIANCAMPSDNYITLTLGASGTSYTAPADGWFFISAKTSGTNYQIRMAYSDNVLAVSSRSDSLQTDLILPVEKGRISVVSYDGSLSNVTFRFVYANGAK